MKKIRLLAMTMLAACLLASNVFAANMNPSVESQDAPEVIVEEPIIVGDKEVGIVVTPVSKANADDTHEEVSDKLNAAKQDIQQAPTLGDLPSESGTIADDVNKQLEGTGYTADDLIVRDLFDVSLVDDEGNVVEPEDPVALTFAVTVAPDETLIVLHMCAEGVWEVIDKDKVQINTNGTVTVTFDSLSPIAFATVKTEPDEPTEPDQPDKPGEKPTQPGKPADTVTSPQTGETANVYMVIAMLMLLTGAAYCGARAKRTVR